MKFKVHGDHMTNKDSWQTPLDLYNYLHFKHGPFFWDACCTPQNCLCKCFMDIDFEYDYLQTDIKKCWERLYLDHFLANNKATKMPDVIFMNPPYSNPAPFIRKAWDDSLYFKVVILVPTSILSCKYLDFLDMNTDCERNWKPGVTIIPLKRRTRFEHPELKASSPPGGCMLMILERGKYANV